MVGGGSMARWGWCTGLLVLLTLLAGSGLAQAEATYEISPLGTDPAKRVDRYQVILGPGASLWEIGFNRLPLVAIEQGELEVGVFIEQGFGAEYPGRPIELVRPGDSVVLEVPAGTFVSKSIVRQ